MPEASQLWGFVVIVWLYQGWCRLTLFVCLTAAFLLLFGSTVNVIRCVGVVVF